MESSNNHADAIREIRDLTKGNGTAHKPENATHPFALVPPGYSVADLEKFVFNAHSERPERINTTFRPMDVDAFCDYYKAFSDADSIVWGDELQRCFMAFLDYHESDGEGNNQPRWCHHRIFLKLRTTGDWDRWVANNKIKMTQGDFAEFIEDNLVYFVDPIGSQMLEMARDLRMTKDHSLKSEVSARNGKTVLSYVDDTKATFGKSELEMPEEFKIKVPMYVGWARVEVTCRIRYRLEGGRAIFIYQIIDLENLQREAFADMRKEMIRLGEFDILNAHIVEPK